MRIAITVHERVNAELQRRAAKLNLTVSRLVESYLVEAMLRNEPITLRPVPDSFGVDTAQAHTLTGSKRTSSQNPRSEAEMQAEFDRILDGELEDATDDAVPVSR